MAMLLPAAVSWHTLFIGHMVAASAAASELGSDLTAELQTKGKVPDI